MSCCWKNWFSDNQFNGLSADGICGEKVICVARGIYSNPDFLEGDWAISSVSHLRKVISHLNYWEA
jgi:hypothetical protein